GRGRDMPPPVLVPRAETVFGLVDGVDEKLLALTARFWPGPLTIIANAQPSLDWDLGDTHGTVAVRMPDDEYALALLGRTGPLAVSSANVSGSPAATSADEAMEMLGDDVDIYVDGGVRESGISSTIVDLTGDVPKIVREGPVTSDELREIVPDLLDLDG
ncbi:MAG: L-threonylcarbamoyladenylate synthase, partial [Brevibacterium aurantiacum]|nr:L-threonylcarbamoyladenylate synthase [Brevibacterium aurantiacum]